jgi:hypothetical protein
MCVCMCVVDGSKLKPRDSRPAPESESESGLAVWCGAEIGFDYSPSREFHVRSARAVGVARIYLYLWTFFLTRTYSAQQFASLAPEGRNDGWEGGVRADGLSDQTGQKPRCIRRARKKILHTYLGYTNTGQHWPSRWTTVPVCKYF